jgi:poly(A) polymerase
MDELQSRLNRSLLKRIIKNLPRDVPIYLVGGAIRDALLNRPNYDLDFVTPGDAMKIARQVADSLGSAYFPLDTKRKVARVILKKDTQLDGAGENATRIDFSTFQGMDLIQDLQGRDFTMNAMAVKINQLDELMDPLGGVNDLLSKHLRACSPRSLLDDPVRILRAVRFSVDLDLSIPSETLQLIKQATGNIPEVSAERLRDELFRILLQSHPSTALRILDKINALEYILPEVCALKEVKQSPPHIMDVWDHTLDILVRLENIIEVLSAEYNPEKSANLAISLVALKLGRYRQNLQQHFNNALNPDRPHRGLFFLAGLYHDVGKLRTQTVDEKGKIRFIEHEHIGSRLVEKRGKALKLSNLEIERLVNIVTHHMRPSLLSHEKEIPNRRVVYRYFRDTGAAGVDICILSLADLMATYGPTLPQERWIHHLDVVRALLSAWCEDHAGSILPPLFINGDELMNELELSPGPLIGYLLETIREAQVAGEIQNRDEAIRLAQRFLAEN